MTTSLQLAHIRDVSTVRKVYKTSSAHHVLNVAFNNFITASEKHFDGKPMRSEAGRTVARTLYLPPGSELRGWSIGQVDFLRIGISHKALQAACDEAGKPIATVLKHATPLDDPLIWHVACILRRDQESGVTGGALLQDSMQSLLAHHLVFAKTSAIRSGALPRGSLAPSRFRAVQEYIASHLHREIRLAELAAIAGTSVFHFLRAFKVTAGKSPYQYVLEQRLNLARRLLEGTALSIEELGTTVGFATATGFAAAFKQKCGLTPSAYRRAAGTAN